MADGKEYVSRPDELGNIHISEEVLAVIAAAAAMEVEGVGSLAANLGSDIAELLGGKKNLSKGIHIAVEEESIRVDVSLLIKYGYTIIDVAKEVQNAVYSAVCQRPCAGRCLRPGWKEGPVKGEAPDACRVPARVCVRFSWKTRGAEGVPWAF